MTATLTMPLFVSPDDVMLRMQLNPELDGVLDIVTSGIIGAQLHLQRIVDGRLQRLSQDARYYVDSQSFSGIAPNGAYRLEVPSGFIRSDTPVVVESSNPRAGPFEDLSAVDEGLMRIDYPRGYINLDANTYGDCHVRIRCDTGFEDGTASVPIAGLPTYGPTTQYFVGDQVVFSGASYQCVIQPVVGIDPSNAGYWTPAKVSMETIPNEIYEAIISLVPMVFNNNQTTNRSDEAQKQYKTATDHAELLLQPYVRTKGFTFRHA